MLSWLWAAFRESKTWRGLRAIPSLRSVVYLTIELRRSLLEPRTTSKDSVDSEFLGGVDPFRYDTSLMNRARFLRQKQMLDSVSSGERFANALEIGCAEGHFTEVIADCSQSLLVLEISPTALARVRQRRDWGQYVSFIEWDLRSDVIPGTYDLIVLTGVLEYFQRRSSFKRIRASLVAALKPGGYLLLESAICQNSTVANAWWSKYLIRGEWINTFIAGHKELELVENTVLDIFVITLLRKR
jgi:2-polyprenyl-3-methyl-5-hydroxy-6-metoxy-1,4-benzoquinol methylase